MEKKKPAISIIVPVYNVEQYLDRCLNSIVNQSFSDIEIILIDDGSPDNSPSLCDKWAKRDKRIKVIHKKNGGLGYARNSGLEIAEGEYVAFVDSDDYVAIDMYEKLYFSTDCGQVDVVYCGLKQELSDGGFEYIHDYDTISEFNCDKVKKIALSFLHKTELVEKRLFMSVWHGIYKRDIIEKNYIRFFSERDIGSEDLPFQVQFCLNAQTIKFMPDYLYTYCFNSKSLSHKFEKSKFDAAFKLRELMIKIVNNNEDSRFYIDAEFYGRIRALIRQMFFAKTISLKEKMNIDKKLCKNQIWDVLHLSPLYKETSWKYTAQFVLLKSNSPYLLMMFTFFDKYINKENLYFWK